MQKPKKICKYLNYVAHLLILALTVTACVSISALASSLQESKSISQLSRKRR